MITIQLEEKRKLYEDLKYDFYNSMEYWHKREDLIDWEKINQQEFKYLIDLYKAFEKYALESCFYLFYKGSYIYFTYKEKRYFIMLTFLDVNIIDFIEHSLESLGATDIYINEGELD